MAVVLSHSNCIKIKTSHTTCEPSFAGVPILVGLSVDMFDPLGQALDAVNSLMGSLAPMKPFFDVLALAVQAVKCVQEIPDAIIKLDPSGIINCIPKLAERMAAVMGHLPQVSLFKMVAGMVCLLITLLEAIKTWLETIRDSVLDLSFVLEQNITLNDPNLGAMISCGEATMIGMLDGLSGLFDMVMVIIDVVNIFLELAQLDPIEIGGAHSFGLDAGMSLEPTWLDPIIEILDTTIASLRVALAVIPTGVTMMPV